MTASVGVREFKDRVSGYVDRVEAGEVITVTRHGKPVARLIPAGAPPGLAKLLAEGRVRWGGSKPSLPTPVGLTGKGKTASEYVSEGRR